MTDPAWRGIYAEVMGRELGPQHVLYTVNGAGVDMWTGYQADVARQVDQDLFFWQPVAYPGTAFPMGPSVAAGEAEFARLLGTRPPGQTWGFVSYSEGAIVSSNILDRLKTDLAPYAGGFIGGSTFGNPRREAGHTLPGGIDPGGSGIVTPNLVGTPVSVWDFANGANIPGSPGNDLYTTCGVGEDAQAVADQRAVWALVDNVTLNSVLGPASLAAAILGLLTNPIVGGIGAIEAIISALGFFGQGLTPHTTYQFSQPIPNNPATCFDLAVAHINAIGAATPARAA